MYDNIRGKTRFLVDSNATWDHLDDAQIIARKKLKGPLEGEMGPQTSACNWAKKSGMLLTVVSGAGLIIILPFEHATQGSLRDFGWTPWGIPIVLLRIL